MLCVTGSEGSLAALAARLDRVSDRFEADGLPYLQEVRLDSLVAGTPEPAWDEVFDLLAKHAPRLVVSCRHPHEGGHATVEESARVDLLARAAQVGVRWVDLEAAAGAEAAIRLRQAGSTGLVRSTHPAPDRTGGEQGPVEVLTPERSTTRMKLRLHAALSAVEGVDADMLKLAVMVDDPADLAALLAVRESLQRPAVLIGMGEAGVLSRVRYAHFGSPWAYVAADLEQRNAPGQLTLEQALSMGLPAARSAPMIALLGGSNVAHSPGPAVYNRLFRARGLPWSYFPVATRRPAEVLALLPELDARGASVTMPHKPAALAASQPDVLASLVGAANTLRWGARGLESTNTDVIGVSVPLRQVLTDIATSTPDAISETGRALVLGAGGAARAAGVACRELGLDVVYAVRNPTRARENLGATEEIVPWDARAEQTVDVVINATPVGGAESPWPADVPLRTRVVFDLALAPEPSALLEAARRAGAFAIGPEAMWVVQGAAQLEWITGVSFSEDDLAAWLSPRGNQFPL